MNPFLSDTVAVPDSQAGRRPWRTSSTSPKSQASHMSRANGASPGGGRAGMARRLVRRAGALAMAAGLVFLPIGAAGAMDVNTATSEQLQTLRGIGGKTAGVIVQERERGGRFTSLQDLSDRVRGIGPKRLESLRAAGLTAAAPTAAAASPAADSAGTAGAQGTAAGSAAPSAGRAARR